MYRYLYLKIAVVLGCMTFLPLSAQAAPSSPAHQPPLPVYNMDHKDSSASSSISGTDRASDYEEAFKQLKEAFPQGRFYAIIGGISMDHIVDVKAMPKQSLLLIRTERKGKASAKVVKVEDIQELGMRK